jgi:hypothetical protein
MLMGGALHKILMHVPNIGYELFVPLDVIVEGTVKVP